jgi:hypothetical protein
MDNLNGTIFRDNDGKPRVYIDDTGSLRELIIKIRPNVSKYNKPPSNILPKLFGILAIFLVAMLFVVIVLELLVGCGEVSYLADGTWKTNECIFQHTDILTGTWK